MGGSAKKPAQCVVETDSVGYVLAGTVRSITLVIADARRQGADYAYVRSVSGEPTALAIFDQDGDAIDWRLREPSWD